MAASPASCGFCTPNQCTVTPYLTGTTLAGASFDLGTLRRYVVVVNFWVSRCAPCRAEAADLVCLATQSASEGVRFVGVDIRVDRAAALAFEHEYAAPIHRYSIPTTASPPVRPWPPVGTLTTYVIDTHGRIAAVFASGMPGQTALGRLLAVALEALRPPAATDRPAHRAISRRCAPSCFPGRFDSGQCVAESRFGLDGHGRELGFAGDVDHQGGGQRFDDNTPASLSDHDAAGQQQSMEGSALRARCAKGGLQAPRIT